MNDLERLAGRGLLMVTGKGGVGKSTLTAALGSILADTGVRVLLLETDPRESVYRLLGIEPSGGAIVNVRPDLFVQNLRPMHVIDQLVRERLPFDFLVRRVLASPVYNHFAQGAPGLKELAILGHALRLLRGIAGGGAPEVDLVVLDAPATGHGLSLLAAPGLVSSVITDGPFGELGGELARFVNDPQRCGVVVATLAEEMPVQEAVELIEGLDHRFERRPELVVVNGLYPPSDGPPDGDDPALDLWARRREVNDQELRRLETAWDGPRVDLPLLPIDRGPELITALAGRLADELTVERVSS